MSDDLFGVVVDGRKLLFKYGDSYNRFSDEYYHYVKSNTPVYYIENDLLKLMYKNGIDYFRVPKNKTLVGHDIAFVFKRSEEKNITMFEFIEVQKY